MKRQLLIILAALAITNSALAADIGTVVFRPTFVNSNYDPAVIFNGIQVTGYFTSKGCAYALNGFELECFNINPAADTPATLTTDIVIDDEVVKKILIKKAAGDSLSNNTIPSFTYKNPRGLNITCTLANGNGSIVSGVWSLPFTCHSAG